MNEYYKSLAGMFSSVYFYDGGDVFLDKWGTGVNKELMTDGLHPNREGVREWMGEVRRVIEGL